MNLDDQVWLKLPSSNQNDWIYSNLDMDHNRTTLLLKIGLVYIVVRAVGINLIWGDLYWLFSFYYTFRH